MMSRISYKHFSLQIHDSTGVGQEHPKESLYFLVPPLTTLIIISVSIPLEQQWITRATNTPKTSAGPGAFMVVEEHQQQKSHTTNVTPYVLLGAGWLGDCVANILATTLGWDSRMDERPPPVQKRSSRYTELTLLLLLLLHGACVFGHDSNMHTDELGGSVFCIPC